MGMEQMDPHRHNHCSVNGARSRVVEKTNRSAALVVEPLDVEDNRSGSWALQRVQVTSDPKKKR